MSSILGIGNALVDILVSLPSDELLGKYQLPKGSMQHVDEATSNSIFGDLRPFGYQLTAGGLVANTVAGLAKLGIPAGYIGKLGADTLGDNFEADQQRNGVRSSLLRGKASSGRAMVLISNDAERTFAVWLGAAIELSAADLNPAMFEGYSHIHIEGYLMQNHQLVEQAASLAKQRGMTVSLDMASYNVVAENRSFLCHVLANYVDLAFANEDEATTFTELAPEAAVDQLANLCSIAVVKLGKQGSLVKQGSQLHRIGAIDAQAIDATGAGDLYASGFLYGLVRQQPLDTCGALGSLCAGKVVEVVGAKMSNDRWATIAAKAEQLIR